MEVEGEDGGEHEMTDVHRLLLQYFIDVHVEKEAIVRKKLGDICAYFEVTPAELEMVISTINHNMHFLWLEIRRVVDDQTGVGWYGIANTRADDVAKLATSYTEREVEFLKKLIEAIVDYGGMISASQLSNAIPPGMPKHEAKDTAAAFIADHWLCEPRSGHVSLGVRTLLELHSYITESFPDQLRECVFCHELVVLGEGCPNRKCDTQAHFHCLRRWSVGKDKGKGKGKGPLKCPSCTLDWTPGQGRSGPAQRSSADTSSSSSSSKKTIPRSEDEEEEEEEGEGEEEMVEEAEDD